MHKLIFIICLLFVVNPDEIELRHLLKLSSVKRAVDSITFKVNFLGFLLVCGIRIFGTRVIFLQAFS